MSAKWTFWAWDQEIKKAPLKLALLKLADNASDDGISWYSVTKMAFHCGMSTRAFQGHLKTLEGLGFLEIKERPGTSSVYKLKNTEVVKLKNKDTPAESAHLPPQNLRTTPAESADDPNNEPNNRSKSIINESSIDDSSLKNEYPNEFEWIWDNKPEREGGNPKKQAYSACKARLKSGATWREMAKGLNRYRAYCESKGIINTPMVQQMATFFGTKESFKELWEINHEANTRANLQSTNGRNSNQDDRACYEIANERARAALAKRYGQS